MKKIIKFGIIKGSSGFSCVSDIRTEKDRFGNEFTAKWVHHDLTYKKKNFALKKAEQFIKRCHKDFINNLGEKVQFTFVNCGLIEE